MSETLIIKGLYEIMSAEILEENRLPDIFNNNYLKAKIEKNKLKDEDCTYFEKGFIKTILPYTMQDNYNRKP